MLEILSTHTKPLSSSEIKEAHDILRIAYEVTEVEIWGENYNRLFIEEYTTLVEAGEIFVAYLDGKIAGSIHIYAKDKDTYKFSLLSVDFKVGGNGIGTALIKKAEEEALKNGAIQIKIEILRVRGIEVPHKIKLDKYYKRLGYEYTHTADSDCLIPEWKYKLLIQPSDFDFYCKKL